MPSPPAHQRLALPSLLVRVPPLAYAVRSFSARIRPSPKRISQKWPCSPRLSDISVEFYNQNHPLTCRTFHNLMQQYKISWGLYRRYARRDRRVAACTRRDFGVTRLHAFQNAACSTTLGGGVGAEGGAAGRAPLGGPPSSANPRCDTRQGDRQEGAPRSASRGGGPPPLQGPAASVCVGRRSVGTSSAEGDPPVAGRCRPLGQLHRISCGGGAPPTGCPRCCL